MANNKSESPAFPQEGSTTQKGLTKREYFAAIITPALIHREKVPINFWNYLKSKLKKIGFKVQPEYFTFMDPVGDAQCIAIYTDTILSQINGTNDGSRS